jgi:UDP-glucose 4-epimerase
MKKIIVVTGGAGFIGSNLIKLLIDKTNFIIFSIDNYSTGKKRNQIKNKRVKYINDNSKNIFKVLRPYRNSINTIFHFGEFSRIYQSFVKMNDCINSNTIGTNEVFNFCLENKVKLVYSATSASLGNNGKDKNLSPYAFTKAKNLEMLENLKKWFDLKYEIIYFYNVYGPAQISRGDMATVIGIFEDQFKNKKALTVVKPGTQSRRFTHVKDSVEACFYAWKKNKCRHYSILNRENYTILQVAKMFKSKIKFLPSRPGERYASALTSMNLSNKVFKLYGKISLKNYIKSVINAVKK